MTTLSLPSVEIILGVDTTGSMQAVINNAISTAQAIENKLKDSHFNVNLSIAGVNDFSPIHVEHESPIEWNVDLNSITAHGGGDTPEAYSTFIDEACARLETTNENCIRIIILIGDSFGHGMPPIQNGRNHADSFSDGDPNGITIPSSMKRMKEAKTTFYYVLAGKATENSELWGAANAKYTNGAVIPMNINDFKKGEENPVAKTLSMYIEGQVSMISALNSKKNELGGKSVDEIAKILADFMNEKGKKIAELSETVEHSATDAMIDSVDSSTSNTSFYRSLGTILENSQTRSMRHYSNDTVGHFRGGTRDVSATIETLEADSRLPSIQRVASLASQRF